MMSFSDLANPWVPGLPIYEPGRPIEEVARELGFKDAGGIVKMASNENALGPSPLAVEAMAQAASQMHRYPDGGGYYLKSALGEKLGVNREMLIPGTGSNELLELIGHVFLGPEAGIVMADRAFVVYRLIAASSRANVVAVPMRDYVHDLDAMLDAVVPETRVVFVSNPNNPTGTMVSPAAVSNFMRHVPDHVVVCFDEAYIELVAADKRPDTLRYVREGRKVIVLRTFSKVYGLAGLRIGYAVAPAECVGLLNRVRQPFNVNAMAMAAAIAALGDDEHVEQTRQMVAEGLEYLQGEFSRMRLPYVPAVTNFILVEAGGRVNGPDSGRAAFERLQSEGVIVRPMDGYGLPMHVRVTVGTRAENGRLVVALEKILS